jgi:hypothetical protein
MKRSSVSQFTGVERRICERWRKRPKESQEEIDQKGIQARSETRGKEDREKEFEKEKVNECAVFVLLGLRLDVPLRCGFSWSRRSFFCDGLRRKEYSCAPFTQHLPLVARRWAHRNLQF